MQGCHLPAGRVYSSASADPEEREVPPPKRLPQRKPVRSSGPRLAASLPPEGANVGGGGQVGGRLRGTVGCAPG